jgi:hypothetical protein
MLSLDFTGAGQGEPFLDTGFRLHFWHYYTNYILIKIISLV